MSGPERHRRANHSHPARKPRDGRRQQRTLKQRIIAEACHPTLPPPVPRDVTW